MQRRLAAEVVIAGLILPAALELCSAARVLRAVERVRPRAGRAYEPEEVARYVDALLRRLPGVWRHTCLRRAVVLAALLRRDGRAATVVIGVRRERDGGIAAHAWLRCEGVEPFLERGADTGTFAPLRRGGR